MAIGDNIPSIFGDLAAVSMRSGGDIQYFLDLIQNRDADQLLALRNLESGGIPAPIGSPFDQNMAITGGDSLAAMGMVVDNAFTQPSSGGDVTKAKIDLAAQQLFNNSPGTIPDRSIISSVADDIEVSPNDLASAYNSMNQSVMADMEEDALRQSYDLNGAAISPFIDIPDTPSFPETLLPNTMEPNIESGMLRPSSLFSDPDPASMLPTDPYGTPLSPDYTFMPPPYTRERGAFDVFSPESARYVPRREGEIAAYPPMPVGEFDKAWQDYYASGGAVPEDTRGLLQDIGKFPFPWSIGGQTVLPPSPSLPNLTPDLSSLEYIKQMERATGLTPTEENDPMLARILAREAAPVPTTTPVPATTTPEGVLNKKLDRIQGVDSEIGETVMGPVQPESAARPVGSDLKTGESRGVSFPTAQTETQMRDIWKSYLPSVVPNYYVPQVQDVYSQLYQPFLGNYLLDANRRNVSGVEDTGFIDFLREYQPETGPVLDWPKLQPSYNNILDLADLQDENSRGEWRNNNSTLNDALVDQNQVISIALARYYAGQPVRGGWASSGVHSSLVDDLERYTRQQLMVAPMDKQTLHANWLKELSISNPERWGR